MSGFSSEDFAHIADLLRTAIEKKQDAWFSAVLSNNFNIILAALDIAAESTEGIEKMGAAAVMPIVPGNAS